MMTLDYTLLPFHQVQSLLAELPVAGEVAPGPVPSTRTTLYVWGYGRPRPPLPRLPFRYTEAAARFATERGWDEDGWGAWVVEVELTESLCTVVWKYGPRLQLDPAIAGWGVRMVREPRRSRRMSCSHPTHFNLER